MGFLSSASSFLRDLGDKFNSFAGSTPPANMTFSTDGHHNTPPIKVDPDTSEIKVYDPLINSSVADAVHSHAGDLLKNGISINRNDLTGPKATPPTGGHDAEEYYSSPVTPAQLEYLNAELASYYGMSKETAYQEALSNTAYQRSVKDMQAAGLSPAVLYGAGKGTPADGVYSVRSATSGGGGGSGGSSRRSSGSSKNNGKLFSTGEYYGISAAAGLAAAVVSGNPGNYWIGSTVAQGFMTAADSLLRR